MRLGCFCLKSRNYHLQVLKFGASYKPLTFILSVWVNWNEMQMWKDLVSLGVVYIWWRFSWNSNCFYYVLTRIAYQILPKAEWVIYCKELVVKCLLPIACVLCGSPQFRESWDRLCGFLELGIYTAETRREYDNSALHKFNLSSSACTDKNLRKNPDIACSLLSLY